MTGETFNVLHDTWRMIHDLVDTFTYTIHKDIADTRLNKTVGQLSENVHKLHAVNQMYPALLVPVVDKGIFLYIHYT